MILRRVAMLVCAVFIAGILSSAALAMAPHASSTAGGHAGDSHCPDPDADGAPCGPACPCACCPGHLPSAVVRVVSTVPAQLAPPAECVSSQPDDLHPEDVPFRIFHPPRA